MAALDALLVGGGLFVLAMLLMMARGVTSPARLLIVVVLALLTSGASAFHATMRHAGTGLQVSRGYPKPFHFRWTSLEGPPVDRRSLNPAYYAANSVVHLGVIALLAALLVPRRDPHAVSTMAPGMVVLRITLGVFFLILAVIGGLLPVLQGWIFFLLAILVLFPKAKFTEKILVKAEPKAPRVIAFLRRIGIGAEPPPRDTIPPQ